MTRLLVISYLSINRDYPGGSWVDSFLSALSKTDKYSLGVLYPSETRVEQYHTDGIAYYPLYARHTYTEKLKTVLFNIPRTLHKRKAVDAVIADFRPDVILLFGMETMTGGLVSHVVNIPVVVHLQGIISEIVKKWFPDCVNPRHSSKYFSLRDRVFKYSPREAYKTVLLRAADERNLFQKYRYYLGRTDWDMFVSRKYSPGSSYYHCDELLRKEFGLKQWQCRNDKPVVITTVLNGEIYKGFDNILLTASNLLRRGIDFVWNVYGAETGNPVARFFEDELHLSYNENNVRFKGKKTAAELAEALADSSLYVHPSHIDNSPNSLCEAMMVGLPCIAMNVGGVSSIITDGVDGFLVDDYDVDALADRIVQMTSDAELCMKVSFNARERASNRHSSENVVAQFNDAISNILNEDGK